MRVGVLDGVGRQRGVTLVELMVSLFVGAILMIGMLALWQHAQEAYLQGAEAVDVQQNLRVAMDRMVRVIQAAGLNPTNAPYAGSSPNDPAFAAFREAGTRCLRAYADLSGDADVADTDENLYFTWSGTADTALTQDAGGGPDAGQPYVAVAAGAQELALGIVPNPGGTPIFQYFTGPNDATPNTLLPASGGSCGTLTDADRSRIGRVVITLTARGWVGGQSFTKTLVSEARPRNVP